jgi:dipeptidyl aminopeptidase/acylaminoacyl peptidase
MVSDIPTWIGVSAAFFALLWIQIFGATLVRAEEPLIPRARFFQPAELRDPRISPDGRQLAYLAVDSDGIDNLWVRRVGAIEDELVTHERLHGIPMFRWAEDSAHLLYEMDTNGDEKYHVYIVDLRSGNPRDLTPYSGARAQNLLTSAGRPGEILVGLNLRDPRIFDMYRIDLASGRASLDTENSGDVMSWTTDSKFVIRAATAFDSQTGETLIRVRNQSELTWRQLAHWSFEDSLMFGQISGGSVVAGFGPDDRTLFVMSTEGSNVGRLVEMDARSGRRLAIVACDPHTDVAVDPDGNNLGRYAPLVMISPLTHRVQAVGFEYLSWRWQICDTAVGNDLRWGPAQYARGGGWTLLAPRQPHRDPKRDWLAPNCGI